MIRPILRYGDPRLHCPAAPVAAIDARTTSLVDDLLETLRAARGIGLAAPQVGVSRRICVIDLSGVQPGRAPMALINPRFLSRSGLQLELEGCLSLPGIEATVARPASVTLTHLSTDGLPQTLEATGLLARAIQHEVDHLDGVLFIDRLRAVNRRMILRAIERRRMEGTW